MSKTLLATVAIDHLKTDLPVIDDYLEHHQPESLLGLPILNQGNLVGILYLENRITSGVFSHDRLLVLNFLSSQSGDRSGECPPLSSSAADFE